MISELIIIFITCMTYALAMIKTILNFKHSIIFKQQKIVFLHILIIFSYIHNLVNLQLFGAAARD